MKKIINRYFIITKEQATEKFHFAGCKTEDEK